MRFHIGLSLNFKTLKKWILPIFLGVLTFFSLKSVFAYDFTDWKQPTQVVVEGLDGSTWYTFGTCSTGTLCGRTDYYGNLNRLQATYTYSQYFDTSKIYTITVASPFNNENCFKFGSEDISLRMTETPNGSSWYVTEIGQTSCVGQDGMSFYSFSFKPTRTNFTKFAISLNFSNQMLGPAADVRFSTKFNIVENENWDKVISQQNQTIINQNQTIINQGKETNEKLDETNDKLEDLEGSITNPSIDSDTGNDFFNNFQTEDNGGISGIITAPLTLINSLLDGQGTCTDLKFSIMGKEVALPSGCIIWDKVPNEMEVLIQTLVCGTGAYFLLRQLFKDIEKLKNPNNSEVSTLDL